MPVMKGKSGLMAKYGNRVAKAHDEHKDDETTFGQSELPPIPNGIAQLIDCKFDTYKEGDNKGEYYFSAAGMVVEPRVAENGVTVFGQHTRIREPLHDTLDRKGDKARKTFEEHYAWVLNELRKLGVDTSAIGPDDLDSTAAALKEAAPYFRFRTYVIPKKKPGTPGYNPQYDGPDAPPPRTQHQWNGQCDYSPEEGMPSADTTPSANGEANGSADAGGDAAGDTGGDAGSADVDIADLVAKAEAQDGDAQQALTDMAIAAGADEDAIKSTNSWQEVADLIGGGGSAAEPEPEPKPEKAWEPVKGEIHPFAPMIVDSKTKKQSRAKKPIDCEVTAVDKKKRTMDLKNLDNPKLAYKGISWDDEGLSK